MSRATAAISASHMWSKWRCDPNIKVSHVGSVMSCYIVTCRVKPLRKSKKETVNWTNRTFQRKFMDHTPLSAISLSRALPAGPARSRILAVNSTWIFASDSLDTLWGGNLIRFSIGHSWKCCRSDFAKWCNITLNASDSPEIISSSSVLHGRNLLTKWGMDRDCDFMPWVKDNAFFSQFGNTSWKMVQPF